MVASAVPSVAASRLGNAGTHDAAASTRPILVTFQTKLGTVSETSLRSTAQPYKITQSVMAVNAIGVIADIKADTTPST